jgi:hypothetical protein
MYLKSVLVRGVAFAESGLIRGVAFLGGDSLVVFQYPCVPEICLDKRDGLLMGVTL